MSARILLEVALRILGLWFLFTSVNILTTTVSLYMTNIWGSGNVDMTNYLVAYGVNFAVQFAIGLGAIRYAPVVAARFYPAEADDDKSPTRIGPGDLYHTACFVLGVYLLVSTAGPAGRFMIASMQGGWGQNQVASEAFTMLVNWAAGIFLIFGSRRIGELTSSLRYDPEAIPKQRFSVTNLILLFVFVTFILWAIRRMTLGGI